METLLLLDLASLTRPVVMVFQLFSKSRSVSADRVASGIVSFRYKGALDGFYRCLEFHKPRHRGFIGATLIGVCTENLNPNVLTMKSAQYGARIYDAGSLNLARDRRIFVQ
jgi:hypothetical protein